MGTPKISSFIIALILVSFFAGSLGIVLSQLVTKYDVSGYDNETMASFNKLNELSQDTEEIKDEMGGISEKPGVLDIIGGYFSDAYRVLIMTKDSFDIFDNMTDKAVDELNLGSISNLIKITIGSIILILIFIGVILRALINNEV